MSFFSTKKLLGLSLLLVISLGLVLGVSCVKTTIKHSTTNILAASSFIKKSGHCCENFIPHNLDSLKTVAFAIPSKIGWDLTLLILGLAFAFIRFNKKFFKNLFVQKNFIFYKLYIKSKPRLLFPNDLKFVFAFATPNPKIY